VIGAIAYGGGRATAVTVEVGRAVPGADAAVAAMNTGQAVSYVRGHPGPGPARAHERSHPDGTAPGRGRLRPGQRRDAGFPGAKCRACGTISTPPTIHPRCTGCGGGDLDVVRLARRGTVQTFVVNQTMPPPFQAPLPMVVVDLDDGARIMVQGSSADAGDLAIDDVVTLSLRLYASERGIPVYGYKAFRVETSGRRNTDRLSAGAGNGVSGAGGGGR
jgi:uncharacterized OB-fold protein